MYRSNIRIRVDLIKTSVEKDKCLKKKKCRWLVILNFQSLFGVLFTQTFFAHKYSYMKLNRLWTKNKTNIWKIRYTLNHPVPYFVLNKANAVMSSVFVYSKLNGGFEKKIPSMNRCTWRNVVVLLSIIEIHWTDGLD